MAGSLKLTSVTVVKKFNKKDGTFFKFETAVIPSTIAGESADEIIFCSGNETGLLLINGCSFDYKTQSLRGSNITQNFQLNTSKV